MSLWELLLNFRRTKRGILFWADQTWEGQRIVYTNLKWEYTGRLHHEWGRCNEASLRLAMEIIENILRQYEYSGEVLDYGKQFYSEPGQDYCFWMTWRISSEFQEKWLSTLSRKGSHTLDYTTMRDWIMERVNMLEDQ